MVNFAQVENTTYYFLMQDMLLDYFGQQSKYQKIKRDLTLIRPCAYLNKKFCVDQEKRQIYNIERFREEAKFRQSKKSFNICHFSFQMLFEEALR